MARGLQQMTPGFWRLQVRNHVAGRRSGAANPQGQPIYKFNTSTGSFGNLRRATRSIAPTRSGRWNTIPASLTVMTKDAT